MDKMYHFNFENMECVHRRKELLDFFHGTQKTYLYCVHVYSSYENNRREKSKRKCCFKTKKQIRRFQKRRGKSLENFSYFNGFFC
jgi:hypothetical protein